MTRVIAKHLPWIVVAGIFVLVGVGFANTLRTLAQTQVTLECKAAIVIDRSASVRRSDINLIREQIQRLFEAGGIYDDQIKLAFWSFSSSTNRNSNYNAPFHGYVGTRSFGSAEYNSFMQALSSIDPGGGTNYEQGFAFDRGIPNQRDGMDRIVEEADLIVFMTDGVPNAPGTGDNNATARQAGRDAVKIHVDDNNKIVVGGVIGTASHKSLDYVINNYPYSNPTRSIESTPNLFRIADFSNLYEALNDWIQTKCKEILPEDSRQYNLTPMVTTDDRVTAGVGGATFHYSVTNATPTGSSSFPTKWSIKRVLVRPYEPIIPITSGFHDSAGNPYQNGFSCERLLSLIYNEGSCEEIKSGERVFGPGDNDMALDVGDAASVILDDGWETGTKVCFVLSIEQPTHRLTPANRFSRAACTTVGKRPFVQVWGGDVKVGHYSNDSTQRADIIANTIIKSNGNTYGSWAEYAIFTSGSVRGFASMAGLEGGYPSTDPNSQLFWSTLTFANTDNEFGHFTVTPDTLGSVPDTVAALLARYDRSSSLNASSEVDFSGNSKSSGLYLKDNGGIELQESTIAAGKTYILHVPDGTVRITGDIRYADGPYRDIKQIPQLVIIAKNIMIDEDVTNVDAWLIAMGDESNGVINTCNVNAALTIGICDKVLRINGPVMARKLELHRTAGAGIEGAAGDPAEIINLPANTLLWSHTEGRSEMRIQTTYSVELPPYF